jgi:HK97 family phage prohead protease
MQNLPELEVVRAVSTTVRAKADDAGAPARMEVRFSAFDRWYEIDSIWEGHFLERTAPGAFAKTISESRDQVKVLFNHGFDPQIGSKVLGTIDDLREDPDSPVGDVDLFDTAYVRDLLPGLEAGVYGSSFRMKVTRDEWNKSPGVSEHNPQGLPERTIKEVRLFEFGPVTFPANPSSTASVRSMTDTYVEGMRSRDPLWVDELTRSRDAHNRTSPVRTAGDAAENPPPAPASSHPGGLSAGERRQRLNPNLTKEVTSW